MDGYSLYLLIGVKWPPTNVGHVFRKVADGGFEGIRKVSIVDGIPGLCNLICEVEFEDRKKFISETLPQIRKIEHIGPVLCHYVLESKTLTT